MEGGIGLRLLELSGQAEFKVQVRIACQRTRRIGASPSIVESVGPFGLAAVDLILCVTIVATTELHGVFALGPRESKHLVIVLGAILPRIVPRSPCRAEGRQAEVWQAVSCIISCREIGLGAPARGLRERRSSRSDRRNENLVAIVVDRRLK